MSAVGALHWRRGLLDAVDVVVVGAGPAGLAVSSELARAGVQHLVLERARVAESWRTQRWDSFRLNTPAWANRVPAELVGPPDRFADAGEHIRGLERLAGSLPVAEGVEVVRVRSADGHWRLETSAGAFAAGAVVVASGFQNVPRKPAYATALPPRITHLHAADYRRPRDVEDAVLVVGGGQSGLQIAADLLQGGRRVYLSTSRVGRMPRHHRGRDAFVWLRETGQLDLRREHADPGAIAGSLPQLSGVSSSTSTSYQHLARHGATLLGRTLGWDGHRLRLAPDLGENILYADQVSQAFRAMWDAHAGLTVSEGDAAWQEDAADAPAGDLYDLRGPRSLDLAAAGISTVIWATGFDASVGWLPESSLDQGGRPRLAGLHVVGAPWLTHSASGNLYGIAADATELAHRFAGGRRRVAA